MEFDYERNFKILLYAMRLNKSHPAVKRDIMWIFHFIFFHTISVIVFLLILYNIIFHDFKTKHFTQSCKNGILSLMFVAIIFQYCITLWKHDLLLNLMTLMKEDYHNAKHLPRRQQKIIYKYGKKGATVCKRWLILACAGGSIFPLKSIISMVYHMIQGETQLIPVFDFIFPGVIEENKDNIYVFLSIHFMWVFYGLYSMCMSVAFVPLGPTFMLHACGQLDIVELKISLLFKGEFNEAIIEEELKKIIKHLQYIYNFVEHILLSFRVAYELTLKATTIILPITCYEIIEAYKKGGGALEFLTFIICEIMISSSPCYYGELLLEKGENVRQAIYFCGWEKLYSRRIRSTICIILTRTLRPFAIRTVFRTVCLENLTDLFRQSYAIYSLMNVIWK